MKIICVHGTFPGETEVQLLAEIRLTRQQYGDEVVKAWIITGFPGYAIHSITGCIQGCYEL